MMKKCLLSILAVLFAGIVWAYNFSAVSPSGHTLYYNYTSGGVAVTSGSTVRPTGALTIPDSVTHGGTTYAVVGIEYAAFDHCTALTSVTIPNTVTSIGSWAFNNCTALTSINLPNTLTTISDMTFKACSSLTNLVVPSSVQTIGQLAFFGCTGFAVLDIPSSVTSIGTDAFGQVRAVRYCGSATGSPWGALNVNCGIYREGDFYYADSTKTDLWFYVGSDSSVVVADGVNTISSNAFAGLSSLVEVELPSSVASIGQNAFLDCTSLRHVILRSPNPPALLTWYVVFGTDSNLVISIPCGTYDTYTDDLIWYSHRNQLAESEVELNVIVVADSSQGTATVIPIDGRIVSCDSTVVISATANYGYHFDHWSTGSTLSTDTVALAGDTVITAIFAPEEYSVILLSNNDSIGTTEGSGQYFYLDTATLTATAVAPHYHFSHWSDGVTENPRQLVVTEMVELTAYFAPDTHLVTVVSGNPDMGTVDGGGWVEACSEIVICATPLPDFHFLYWDDGDTNASRSILVVGDTTLTAYFAANELEGISSCIRDASVLVQGCDIVVRGATGQRVTIFDVSGRIVVEAGAIDTQYFRMTHPGVYLVKVGRFAAQKVLVAE